MYNIILEKTTLDVEDPNLANNVFEEVLESIPTLKKLRSKVVRQKLFEDYGDSAFLDPYSLEFPIVNPDVKLTTETINKIPYDCNLILSSYCHLKNTNGDEKMITKAKKLLNENLCPQIYVHLETLEEIIDIETILFYFKE